MRKQSMVSYFILLGLLLLQLVRAEFISGSITPTSYTISDTNAYLLKLVRNINPITFDFISPVAAVPLTSTISLVMPANYATVSALTNPACRNADTSETLTCQAFNSNLTIVISGYFSASSSLTTSNVNIQIDSIVNPAKAGATANFVFSINAPDGSVVDQSPAAAYTGYSTSISFIGGSFSSCTISANSNYVLTGSRFTFNLSPTHSIPPSGKIILDFPSTWISDVNSQSTFVSTAPTCSNAVNMSGTPTCTFTILPSPISLNRITITVPSSGTLSSSFAVDVSQILTPPYINYERTVSITSQWSDGTNIDSCTSAISNTLPIPFKSINLVSQSSTTVQSQFSGSLSVQIAQSFYYQDTIQILLPSNFYTSVQVTSSNFPIFLTDKNPATSTVTLSSFGGIENSLPANNQLTFTLAGLVNFESV